MALAAIARADWAGLVAASLQRRSARSAPAQSQNGARSQALSTALRQCARADPDRAGGGCRACRKRRSRRLGTLAAANEPGFWSYLAAPLARTSGRDGG